jgi:hypothetical protein
MGATATKAGGATLLTRMFYKTKQNTAALENFPLDLRLKSDN